MLEKWDPARGVYARNRVRASDKMQLLTRLAFDLHTTHRRHFCADMFALLWDEKLKGVYRGVSANDALWEMRVFNSVIRSEGRGRFSMGHLSFQEFLVARAIVQFQRQGVLLDKYYDPWWRNVLVFYAGTCGDISSFLTHLHNTGPIMEDEGLVKEMMSEARFTSRVVDDFLYDAYGEEDVIEDDGLLDYISDHAYEDGHSQERPYRASGDPEDTGSEETVLD